MEIKLRKLMEKDAPLMLEWMQDPGIQKVFQKDMSSITLDDAIKFCNSSLDVNDFQDGKSYHYAIVNEEDEYLGTISLKEVDLTAKTAEYAISTRKRAHGHGVAFKATIILLEKAFNEFGLNRIYLNVLSDNIRAIKFYEKCGFKYEGEFRQHLYLNGEYKNLRWYGILKEEYGELCNKLLRSGD